MGLDQWSKKEKIFLLLAIPLMLFLIYLIPSSIKDAYFILSKNNASIISMFLFNYTHSDFWHLAANLGAYLIVIFLIMKFETSKHEFYKAMAVVFLVLPFIASFATIDFATKYNPYALRFQGFSAIVAGLIGYFPYAVYKHIKNNWKVKLDVTFIYLVFLVNSLASGFLYWMANGQEYIVMLIVAFCLYILHYNLGNICKIINVLGEKAKNLSKLSLFSRFEGAFTFMFAILTLFSLPYLIQATVENGSFSNIIAHYAGYFIGLAFSTILLVIESKAKN